MTTHTTSIVATNLDITDDARVDAAVRQVHEAELAMHEAHQSHVNALIAEASERLHEAVVGHLSILAERLTAGIAS